MPVRKGKEAERKGRTRQSDARGLTKSTFHTPTHPRIAIARFPGPHRASERAGGDAGRTLLSCMMVTVVCAVACSCFFHCSPYLTFWPIPGSHVGAHVIKPVDDFNEVNYHLLETTYVHLYFTKGASAAAGAAAGGTGAGAADDDSMFVDGGAGSNPNLSGLSPRARKMFNFLQGYEGGNEGVNIHVIAQSTGMSIPEVLAASEELITPGLVYTTVDDETFAILSY